MTAFKRHAPPPGPAVHVLPVRVYYEDTDAAGVVYYANYLKFAERARTEFLRAIGHDHVGMLRDHGLAFMVRRCVIDYLKPARLDDHLEVRLYVGTVGGATIDLVQTVERAATLLASLDVRLACVSPDGRPQRLPRPVRAAIDRITRNNRRTP